MCASLRKDGRRVRRRAQALCDYAIRCIIDPRRGPHRTMITLILLLILFFFDWQLALSLLTR